MKDMVVANAVEQRSHDDGKLLEIFDVVIWRSRGCNEVLRTEGRGYLNYKVDLLHSSHKMTEKML